MATTFSLLTNTGKNKEAASLAGGTPLVLTHIAFGDGDRIPAGGEIALENELIRKPITAQGVVPENLNASFFDALLEADDGPFVIREGGLFDQDGDLIAIVKYDPPINKPIATSGQSAEAQLRIIVAFTDLQNLVLQINAVNAYVSAERSIATEDGITGGGDLSADRTHKLAVQSLQEFTGAQVRDENGNRDWFLVHDSSSGTHKKLSPSETAKAIGVPDLCTPEETAEGQITDKAAVPAGVQLAVDEASAAAPIYFFGLQ